MKLSNLIPLNECRCDPPEPGGKDFGDHWTCPRCERRWFSIEGYISHDHMLSLYQKSEPR